jgi:glycosyltransferase involved in cell wall biosynthesis
MNKVIVFRSDLLPLSETFIKAQVQALTRWQPILIGYRLVPGGLSVRGLNVRLIPGLSSSIFGRIKLRLCQLLGMAHRPTMCVLREINARLVHVHFGTEAVDLWPSVRKLDLPMLVTLHGYDINIHREWWEAGHGGIHRRNYPARLLRLAHAPGVRFIAVSEAIRVRAMEFGIPEDKVSVHYIGVETRKFRPGPVPITARRRCILFVGRLVEKKGVEYLIRAFHKVCTEIPTAELVIVGDGPLGSQLQNLSLSLGVDVSFLGALSGEKITAQIDQARVLCLPSISALDGDAEGFGMVLLEAQASGVPVVTSAKGGAAEAILPNQTGYSFTEKDTEALAEHLIKLLAGKRLAEEFSSRAVVFVRGKYEISKCTRALEDLYDTFI